MKVIVDTNVLISGIFWGGVPLKILNLWQLGRFRVLASESILKEYLEVINRLDKGGIVEKLFKEWILENIEIIKNKNNIHYSRDIKDDKFVQAGLSGGAKYLITGDKDLLILEKVSNLKIIKPADFYKLFLN
jgi:uncharacterized protein